MKQTIDLHDFLRAFRGFDGRYVQLGERAGLTLLFRHLEDYETDTREELELDVIGLCCDYACDTVEAIASNYSIAICEAPGDWSDADPLDAVLDYLAEHTVVVGSLPDGRILYQQF